jgi:hypothetical protein
MTAQFAYPMVKPINFYNRVTLIQQTNSREEGRGKREEERQKRRLARVRRKGDTPSNECEVLPIFLQ